MELEERFWVQSFGYITMHWLLLSLVFILTAIMMNRLEEKNLSSLFCSTTG